MHTPGTIIGTHYKVIRLLGQGGMSNIYICQDTHLFGKIWAVKEFTASYADPQEQANALQHFEREARMLSSLSHPNLPTINEYFQYQGHYYLAMEYINGQDLGKLLEKNNGPLPELDVADWSMQCATVLYYLHCQKPDPIIFRDVKPSNIIIVQGTVKLIDFGIARVFDRNKRGDTMRIGSPGYAPPEQYNGSTDQRSDIFALGMTMHHALTGKDPTLSPNPFIIPKIASVNPAVSPELAEIVEKAVKLVPEERFQTMLEFKNSLRAFLTTKRGEGMRGRTTPNLVGPTSVPTSTPISAPASTSNPTPQQAATNSPITNPTLSTLPPTRAINITSSTPPAIPQNSSPLPPTISASPTSNQLKNNSKPLIVPVPPKSGKFGKFCKFSFHLFCFTVIAASIFVSSNVYPLSLPQFVLSSRSSQNLNVYSPIYKIQSILQGDYKLDFQDIHTIYKYVPDRSFVRRELSKTIEQKRGNLEAEIMYENTLAVPEPILLDLVVDKDNLPVAEFGTYILQKQIRRQGGLDGSLLCTHIFAAENFAEVLPRLAEPLNCQQNKNYNGFNAPNILSSLDSQNSGSNITTLALSPQQDGYISPLVQTIKEKKLKGKFYTDSEEIYQELKANNCDVIKKSPNESSKDLSGYWFIEGNLLKGEELTKIKEVASLKVIVLFPTYNDLLNSKYLKDLKTLKSSEAWILISHLHPNALAREILSSGMLYDRPQLTYSQTRKILQVYDSLMLIALKQKGISGDLRGTLADYSSEIKPVACQTFSLIQK